MKWEYKVVIPRIPFDSQGYEAVALWEKQINAVTADGWEMVAPPAGLDSCVYFRRQVRA